MVNMGLSKKFIDVFLIISLVFMFFQPTINGVEDFSITSLNLEAYVDGSYKLEYELEVNPTSARITASFLGDEYENFIATEQDGLILDHSYSDGLTVIDVLGSEKVNVTYYTMGLTNKTKSLWALRFTSPIDVTVELPAGSTIMGLNPTPLSIIIDDNMATLVLPAGEVMVSYIVSSSGLDNEAQAYIAEAEATTQKIKAQGILVPDADVLIQNSKSQYDSGDYIRAKTLAIQAKESALQVEYMAVEAVNSIDDAKTTISTAKKEKRTSTIDEAEGFLLDAQESYLNGEYISASSLAMQAALAANNSVSNNVFTPTLALTWLLVIGAMGGLIYYFKIQQFGKSIPQMIEKQVSLDDIFEDNPHLRLDEREVLRYIVESEEGVFITDIRERFDLPKSSAWRMMRRFEEDELIETLTKGRETFIKINGKYMIMVEPGFQQVPPGSSYPTLTPT